MKQHRPRTVASEQSAATAPDWSQDMAPASNAAAQEAMQSEQQGGSLIAAYQTMMKRAASSSPGQQVLIVNDFFNKAIKYRSDKDNWGKTDHWATPLETLTRGSGDCEDYAIAKYEALRELGAPIHKLRIFYTRVLRTQEAHMVAAYITNSGDFFVMDNYVKKVRPLVKRKDLAPAVYSFNEKKLYLGLDREAGETGNMKKWSNMKERQKEGADPMKGAMNDNVLSEDLRTAVDADPTLGADLMMHPVLAAAMREYAA